MTEAVCRIHGVAPEYRLKLEEALNFYAPESRPEVEAIVKKAVETGEPYDLESLFIPRGSKEKIWVRSLGRAVYSGGKVVKLAGTFQNIDKYKRADEELQRSEMQYRSLTENSPDLIARFDRQYRHLFVNPAAAKAGRYSPYEYVGKTIAEVGVPEEEARKWEKCIKTVFETSQIVDVEDSFETPNGLRNFNTKFVPEFAPDGSIHSVQSIARDITERKQIEKALEESESMLRSILRTASVGIGVVKNRIFEWSNETYQKISGFSENELKGESTRMVYPDDEEFKRAGLMYNLMEKLGVGSIEAKHKQKNGNIIDVMINIAPIIPGDLNSGVTFTLLDITERKKVENEIREMSEDLSLLAGINSLANTGTDIGTISRELSEEIKRIYNCDGAAILLMDRTSQSLVLQNSPFNKQQTDKIESLLGQKLTGIRIKLSSEFMRNEIFMTGKTRLVSSRDEIHQVVLDYTENLLPHKHIPELVKLLRIQSIILIPLTSENKPVGLIEISSKNIFGQNSLKRLSGLSGNLTNIITRKQTETLLKEREEMLRIINENVSDIIWRIDADARITYLSPSVEKILGYRPEEISGQPILNFIAKEYHHSAANNIRKRASQKRGNTLIYYEYEMVTRDRRKIPIEVSSSVIRDNQGNLTGFAGVSRDISERKATEIALKESEAWYKDLVEKAGVAIIIDDMEGKLIYANREFSRLFGYTMKEINKITHRDLIHPDDFERVNSIHRRRLLGKRAPTNYEFRSVKKNGNFFWTEIKVTILKRDGKFTGTRSYMWDIDQRKEAEKTLKFSEIRFRELFSHMSSGVALNEYVSDLDEFVLKNMNETGFRITQIIDKEKVIGKNILSVFPATNNMNLTDDMKKVWRSGKSVRLSTVHFSDDRIDLYIDYYIYKLPSGEIVLVFDNITERILAEQNIWHKYEEIKKLSRHLETVREEERKMIARDLHDDLGQILTAVKMDISWIRNKIPVEKIGIKKRSESAIQIVDQAIQSIRRISSELRPIILDDLGLFETLIAHIRDYENRFKIIVKYKFPETESKLKPDQQISVFRIIQEALTNTARHSGASVVDLDIREKDDNLKILIRDNGTGIPDQKLYSTDSFGLISMRERVLQWDGEITIRGKENEGTTINVSLPLK
jgi:PAS domain S-box-containing protein